ncbi:MAG TPA: endolytic transglycosylase MltG [Pseudonocardiaceae bacterium]
MTDDLGLFTDAPAEPRSRRRRGRGARGAVKEESPGRKLQRRVTTLIVVVLGFGIVGGGLWYGWRQLSGLGGYEDYEGTGEADVVVVVEEGDTTSAIATRLAKEDVVASARAFVAAAADNPRISSIQPGYYKMRTRMSGEAAVQQILRPEARVGDFEVRGGEQLNDVTVPSKDGDKVLKGIMTLISEASCAELNGKSTCVPAEELYAVAEKADLAELGVPEWAVAAASKAEPRRRLEGLIMPGRYWVKPGASAEELLRDVLKTSASRLQAAGMPAVADDSGFTPYEVLVMASLVQREAILKDFGKVARVIHNRLATAMNLGLDSTVNYTLERQEVRTQRAEREKDTPYNTYVRNGLPPTPIGAPSKEAIAAAANPEPGTWLYFVKCEKDGTSCFSDTYKEHEAKALDAQRRGVW